MKRTKCEDCQYWKDKVVESLRKDIQLSKQRREKIRQLLIDLNLENKQLISREHELREELFFIVDPSPFSKKFKNINFNSIAKKSKK